MSMTLTTLADPTSKEDGLAVLRSLLTIRVAEERVLQLRLEEKILGSVHTCIGQEVVPVAVCAALDQRDRVSATYRGHGWALAKGVPLDSFFAELMGRATGTNGGRAGSPYFSAPEYGFVGENSIVAAGMPIANGVAMGLKARGDGGISVTSFGDGATNQGGAHEALVFAIARRLPVLFVCENNSWSEMTPIADTVPVALADRAEAYGLETFRADGSDVAATFAVADSAVRFVRETGAPAFLEVKVPRILGHYNADVQQYRTQDDSEAHLERDPIAAFERHLTDSQIATSEDVASVRSDVDALVATAADSASAAPLPDPRSALLHITSDSGPVETLGDLGSEGKELAFGIAVNRALHLEMEERPELVTFGEDIAIPGGTFGVTRNLRKTYGDRAFDTPISEAAILGAAIGASLEGLRPVVEIMWSDFLMVAFDQIVNQASNVRYISQGKVSAPLVIRMQQGITPGSCAQHSQSLEALIAHIPGIKLGLPSNAADAYAMTRSAIADPDPVVLIESRALYLEKAIVNFDAPIEPLGGARIRRRGTDVAIVSWGRMVNVALEAADLLKSKGVDASVLDLRWLFPLDEGAIERVLRETGGRLVIVHEANTTGGFGGEIAARVVDRHFDLLSAPVRRVALPDTRVPASQVLQQEVFPSVGKVVEAAILAADFGR